MTLILTVATPDFVVQASDRRLTQLDGTLYEDQANKSVVFCGQSTFAYTGLAQMGSIPTDQWLMACLADARSFGDGVERVRREASRLVRAAMIPGSPEARRRTRRMAFVGAGFVGFGQSRGVPVGPDGRAPVIAIISNCFADGNWLEESDVRFHAQLQIATGVEALIFGAGQRLDDATRRGLQRNVERARRRTKTPYPIARILVRQMQSIANQNATVGRNVMCSVIPRSGVTPGDPSMASALIPLRTFAEADYFRVASNETATMRFLYVPGDDNAWPYYGPNGACAGVQIKGTCVEPTTAA